MPRYELAGPSLSDSRNIGADVSRLVNCYRRPTSDGSVIVPVLGMGVGNTFDAGGGADGFAIDGPVRAMAEIEGNLWTVQAGWVFKNLSDGFLTAEDFIGQDAASTTIAGNNGKVCVVANGKYFVDGVEPTPGAFSSFGSVDFLNNYTLLTERNGRRVQWSAPADPATLNGLDFATTESRDDLNIRGMTFGPEYWIFKQKSIERWYLNADGNFEPIPGSTIDKGLKDFRLLARGDVGGFFVADDNKCYICAPGGVMERVSVAGLESALVNDTANACFYYHDEGHEFFVVSFVSRPSWVFDLTTGEWHERAEGVNGAWTALRSAFAYGKWWVGTSDGRQRELQRYGSDNFPAIADYTILGNPLTLHRRIISRNINFDGNRMKVAKLTFNMRTGYDTASAQLFVSRDRGQTWGDPKVRTFTLGDYTRQMTWRSLGQFRNFACELRMTDNVYAPIDSFVVLDGA